MSQPIDLSCPKCGGGRETTTVRYVDVNDYLKCSCTICLFEWQKEPADRAVNPTIPDADLDVEGD